MEQDTHNSLTRAILRLALGSTTIEQIATATGATERRVVKMASGCRSIRVDEAALMAQLLGMNVCEMVADSRMDVAMAIPTKARHARIAANKG